ncbi:MAG: methyltransferase domain-containing protein [Pseudomonadota bacterium]
MDIAREKADAAGIDNIEFEVADIDDLTAPERPYDVILAHSILHLLADPERVLRQLRRMLKPGGLLISSTACIGDTFPLLRYVAPAGRAVGLLPRVNVFREDDFMQWFSRTGFAIEERWQPKPKSGVYIIARTAGDREAAAG